MSGNKAQAGKEKRIKENVDKMQGREGNERE